MFWEGNYRVKWKKCVLFVQNLTKSSPPFQTLTLSQVHLLAVTFLGINQFTNTQHCPFFLLYILQDKNICTSVNYLIYINLII